MLLNPAKSWIAFKFKTSRPLKDVQEGMLFLEHFSKYGHLIEFRLSRCADTRKYSKVGRMVYSHLPPLHEAQVSHFSKAGYWLAELGLLVKFEQLSKWP